MADANTINPITGKSDAQLIAESTALAQKAAQSIGKTFVPGAVNVNGGIQSTGAAGSGIVTIPNPTTPLSSPTSLGLNPSPQIDSSMLQGAPMTMADIQKMVAENNAIYQKSIQPSLDSLSSLAEKYAQAFTPTQAMTDIRNQLSTKQKQLADFDISTQEGQQAQFGLGRPLQLSTGRAEKLGQQASLQRQSFVNEYNALVTNYGLEQENQKLLQDAAKGLMSVEEAKLGIAMKVQERADQQTTQFLNMAMSLQKNQRETLANILEKFPFDPSKMSAQDQQQIMNYGASLGIPGSIILEGMKANYASKLAEQEAEEADLLYKQALTRNVGRSSGVAGSNQTTDNERALQTIFQNNPIVKNYNEILAKQLSVKAILDSRIGGPGDLALVYEFMKGLDPTSVVRETEYATAAKSGNIFAGVLARFNGYLKEGGGFLPDNVKRDFMSIVNSKLAVQQKLYDNYQAQIQEIARRQGLDPRNVTIDFSSVNSGGNTITTILDTIQSGGVQQSSGSSSTSNYGGYGGIMDSLLKQVNK